MALLQGLLALLTNSLGSVFNTAFGWAVVALFGKTSPREKTLLSVVVGAAAAWPLLLLGIAFPKIAAFALALVPLSGTVPSGAVRPIWIGLAAVVPIGVGIAVHLRSKEKHSLWRDALSGFRITLGLALSFVFNLVSAPMLRLWSILHRRSDIHIAVITEPARYSEVGKGLRSVWQAQELGLTPTPAPFWLTIPTRILSTIAGDVFKRYIPEDPVFFQGHDIQAALYPNDLLLRGRPERVSHAASAAVETLLFLPALQTIDPDAQALERRIQRRLRSVVSSPSAIPHAATRDGEDLARALRDSPMPLEDARVIYRQLLQLEQAVEGKQQLLASLLPRVEPSSDDSQPSATSDILATSSSETTAGTV